MPLLRKEKKLAPLTVSEVKVPRTKVTARNVRISTPAQKAGRTTPPSPRRVRVTAPAEMAGKAASMDSRDPAPSLLRYETREKENVYILQAAPIIKFGISA